MKSTLLTTLTVAAALGLAVAAVPAAAQEALAKSSGCLNCHAIDTKKMGPSFKDIAAKYKGKADAEAKLTAQLTAGTGHPAVKAKPEDVTALVKWVLAM
jgi:cytochrome c